MNRYSKKSLRSTSHLDALKAEILPAELGHFDNSRFRRTEVAQQPLTGLPQFGLVFPPSPRMLRSVLVASSCHDMSVGTASHNECSNCHPRDQCTPPLPAVADRVRSARYRHRAVRSLGLSSRASLALPHRATSLGEQGRGGPELPLRPRAFLGKLRGTPETVRHERHDTDESFRIALATLHSLLAYTRPRQI